MKARITIENIKMKDGRDAVSASVDYDANSAFDPKIHAMVEVAAAAMTLFMKTIGQADEMIEVRQDNPFKEETNEATGRSED